MTSPVSPEVMQAAQVLIGASLAAWLLAGLMPRTSRPIRVALLTLYLVGAAGLLLYALSG